MTKEIILRNFLLYFKCSIISTIMILPTPIFHDILTWMSYNPFSIFFTDINIVKKLHQNKMLCFHKTWIY